MARKIALLLFGTAGLALWPPAAGWCQPASGDAPLTYALLINGETFLVQEEQMARLESREHPAVVYQVALRIALTQTVRLERLRFD